MLPPFITQLEIDLLIGLAFSLIAGYIIGAERESRSKAAGIGTHTLVITGAMLFSFMSVAIDPDSKSRIAAQIVSGIGFLGAGLILKDKSNVKNLTTAASIWVSGAIGMAFGFGLNVIGIICTLIVAFIPRMPHINKKSPEASITFQSENEEGKSKHKHPDQ